MGGIPLILKSRLDTGTMSKSLPVEAKGALEEGLVALKVRLPVGFASALHFGAYLLGGTTTDDDVAEQALKQALEDR